MPADPRNEMSASLEAFAPDGGAIVALHHGARHLVMPMRMPHQSELGALEQHQHAQVPTPVAAHIVRMDDLVLNKVADPGGDYGYGPSIDRTLRRVSQMDGAALQVVVPHIAAGTAYDITTMDPLWMETAATARYGHAVAIPAHDDDTASNYLDRLDEARNVMAAMPPHTQKMVLPAVSLANENYWSIQNELVAAEEPLIIDEWHGRGRKQTPLLRRHHRLMNAPRGAYRPFKVAFNVPRRFRGMDGSTAYLLARYGYQAVAYEVVNPLTAMHLSRMAAQGVEAPRMQFVRGLGGWQDEADLAADWAKACICPAHDDALTDITDFRGDIPYYARQKVHELFAHMTDRRSYLEHVIAGSDVPFVEARALLAASVATLTA